MSIMTPRLVTTQSLLSTTRTLSGVWCRQTERIHVIGWTDRVSTRIRHSWKERSDNSSSNEQMIYEAWQENVAFCIFPGNRINVSSSAMTW